MLKLSFVIPCYRSESTITIVVEQIIDCVEKLKSYDYEIILVSDSSPDNVFSVAKDLCEQNERIKAIELSRNFGQHNAMMAGFAHVTGDIVVDVDDDGQLPINELHKLLDKINDGYDTVIAKFEDNEKKSAFRKLGTLLNNYMGRILIGQPQDIVFTSFVVMKRYVVDEILRYQNAYPYLAGLMLRSSGRIVNVSVSEQRNRISGKSGYSFKKLLSLWMNGFTAFSVKPLRIATIAGILSAISGFIWGIWTIINKILAPEVLDGYSSTMAVLLFIGGMIMLMLGIIGEYVGRMYLCINNTPQYIIREKINIKDEIKCNNLLAFEEKR